MIRARRIALVCLSAALGSFAAVPALHLIDHEDDHVHVDGAIVHLDDRHEEEHREGEAPAPASPLDHGDGSLAHFGAAALEASWTPSLSPIVLAAELPSRPQRALLPDAFLTHRARAPPLR